MFTKILKIIIEVNRLKTFEKNFFGINDRLTTTHKKNIRNSIATNKWVSLSYTGRERIARPH